MAKILGNVPQTLKIPKLILVTCKFLEVISSNLATRFAARLFTTPLKYKIPKRELEMDAKSLQQLVYVPAIDKKIIVYRFGESTSKILLVHGWSGRGTQLVKFADVFLKAGYSTVSFDAPAHGKSPGKTTLMPEFIASIMELEKQFGPFEAAVGHSLGGMSLLNATKDGLTIKKLVVIGSGDIIQDIMDEFVRKLQLKREISTLLRLHFEKKSTQTMHNYSAYIAAKEIRIPVLVIHDKDDPEVSVECAHHILENLKNGELMLTNGLGHRKILGNQKVIEKTFEFVNT